MPACSLSSNLQFCTKAEIQLEGYGSDPVQWASAKESRKNGKPNLNSFLEEKDSKGYREMLIKGSSRLAINGAYPTASSVLMHFIQKLSRMTFDQGRIIERRQGKCCVWLRAAHGRGWQPGGRRRISGGGAGAAKIEYFQGRRTLRGSKGEMAAAVFFLPESFHV